MQENKQLLERAFNNLKDNYHKILLVNISTDNFTPILIRSEEWEGCKEEQLSLSRFIAWLVDNDYIHEEDKDDFLNFVSPAHLCSLKAKPMHYIFRRRVGNAFHWVLMEIYPSENFTRDNKEAYLYIRDIDSIYSSAYDLVASQDNYTGLYNKAKWHKDRKDFGTLNGLRLGVVYCDLNGLKQANDTYGHVAGDELILSCAHKLVSVFGDFGRCYRVGGDEFCVMCPTVTYKLFMECVEKLKGDDRFSYGMTYGNMTDTDGLVEEAERLMYIAKDKYHNK
jgi:GGDEF domain-containing protein